MDCHGAGLDLPGDLLPGKVQAREVEGSGRAGGSIVKHSDNPVNNDICPQHGLLCPGFYMP